MMANKETLDIVIPVYNEEACLEGLMERLLALMQKAGHLDISCIFVNDGSKDRSAEMLFAYAQKHKFVKVISFSRNFGHQIAITAGIDHSNADYTAVIDADLQDPPELIPDMLKKAKEGYDVVYGQRIAREGESFFKKITARFFYRLINRVCDINIPPDTGDFRLIGRPVREALKKMREKHRFVRGMVPWLGFRSAPLQYNREKRYGGSTKYPLGKMIKFALDSIFSFSNAPLKLANYVGGLIIFLCLAAGAVALYLRLFTGILFVLLAVMFIGGIQIMMTGLIGEYIGRIFEESKNRPLYVVRETRNIEDSHS
jgi:glycosyltransferase involved in cell wall biosynthesis